MTKTICHTLTTTYLPVHCDQPLQHIPFTIYILVPAHSTVQHK